VWYCKILKWAGPREAPERGRGVMPPNASDRYCLLLFLRRDREEMERSKKGKIFKTTTALVLREAC